MRVRYQPAEPSKSVFIPVTLEFRVAEGTAADAVSVTAHGRAKSAPRRYKSTSRSPVYASSAHARGEETKKTFCIITNRERLKGGVGK